MAIFQPTNVIPSSFTQGTIDVNDNMEISWQVNGNSAMTAFQIDFYLNDANSTPVGNGTGRLTDNCPFYGTDRFGRPQFFTWKPLNTTWATKELVNGNEYKFKITQFYNEGNSEKSIKQTAFVSIVTRSTPTVSLFTTKEDFSTNKTALTIGSNLATSIGYFVADYEQTQGDPIRWIRWEIATATLNATTNQWTVGETLADTGDIYTPTLHYEFNGFFNSQSYAIRCTGISESGQAIKVNSADKNGWIYFNIVIQNQGQYLGTFSAKCLKKENCALLEWGGITAIPYTTSPDNYRPILSDGKVQLLPKNTSTGNEYSVTWNKENQKEMSFPAPWSVAWKGNAVSNFQYSGNLDAAGDTGLTLGLPHSTFSPDGSKFVRIGNDKYIYIYSVNGSEYTFISKFQTPYNYPFAVTFNPTGTLLIVGGSKDLQGQEGYASIYSVDQFSFTYLGDIADDGGAFHRGISSIVFNSSGTLAVLCGSHGNNSMSGIPSIYSVSNSTFTYVDDIRYPNSAHNGILLQYGGFSAFSPDDKIFIISQWNTTQYGLSAFSVEDENFTYIGDILYGNELNRVETAAFTPNGQVLLVGLASRQYIIKYSINENNFVPIGMLTDANNEPIRAPRVSGMISLNTYYYFYVYNAQNIFLFYADGANFIYLTPLQIQNFGIAPNPVQPTVLVASTDATMQNLRICSLNFYPQGHILQINDNIAISIESNKILLKQGDLILEQLPLVVGYPVFSDDQPFTGAQPYMSIIITPKSLNVYAYYNGTEITYFKSSVPIDYDQQPISSISILGGDSGSMVENISAFQGDGGNILPLYENTPNFEPVWDNSNYDLYMSANFNDNLEGGTVTGGNVRGIRLYRQEITSTIQRPIAFILPPIKSIKDFGIRSEKAYKYSLHVYDGNNAFMTAVETENPIATCFQNYSLLVCDYDETNDEYHVRKQYLFALNLSTGSVGNNNNPTLNKNFTAFPTRMPDTANYASGTLQGLIGAIYTVPALIEQIGNYKWTAKPSTMDYFDNVDLEQELYDLSLAPYQLFLRDMKGRLRMIHTSAPITMTTNIKQRRQPISISLPWVESGDASDVTIIQTPDDYGWNNDNQVLDVQLDVDVATGELYATYPFPYNGTKFYLTGVNKENLTAKTPNGITSAQFNLSDVAEETRDGDVTATVNVNTENN